MSKKLKKAAMKVKVVSSFLPSYWYSKKVGDVFDVEPFSDTHWIKLGSSGFLFDKRDCHPIKSRTSTNSRFRKCPHCGMVIKAGTTKRGKRGGAK